MEGKDSVFGGALESIIQNVEKQDAEERKAEEAKKQKTEKPKELKPKGGADTSKLQKLEAKDQDPLKTGKPKELKPKDGKDAGKMKKMEGIEPDENKDDEGKKIEKLTEKETNLTNDVKELVQKAKDAIDGGDYSQAQDLCSRLSQIQAAVAEPKEETSVTEPELVTEPEPMPEEADESFIQDDKLQEMIDSALDSGGEFKELDEAKKDPKAKLRNRGDVTFPAGSKSVTDDKDHFPMNNKKQADNAIKRANQYKEAPPWYKGSLQSLVTKVVNKAKKKYPDLTVTKAAKTPGKG